MSTAWESTEQQEDYRKRSRKRKVDQFSSDPAIDAKIKEHVCPGLLPSTQRKLLELETDEDRELVADFFIDYVHHATRGIAANTKRAYLANLVHLSKYVKEKRNAGRYKGLREMTGDDVAGEKGYLASLKKKPLEDPDERWINTHNNRAQVYSKFFRWLYDPKSKPDDRKTNPVIDGIKWHQKRKENRNPIKKRKDIWTAEEHAVFLKRCEDPRLACYHAMARDTSGRPSELLALRVGDIEIKTGKDNRPYAEVEIGRYGKTMPRTPSLIDSIPYIRAWLAQHPQGNDENAYIFISREHGAQAWNTPLKEESLAHLYREAKKYFRFKLLERPDITPKEKEIIKGLLKKPWHPYWQRHNSLTEYAFELDNPFVFRDHSGHSATSLIPQQVYIHPQGKESNKVILAKRGLIDENTDGLHAQHRTLLAPKYCWSCNHDNKPDARFCSNKQCGAPLIRQAHAEVKKEAEQQKKDLEELKARQDSMQESISSLVNVILQGKAHIIKNSIDEDLMKKYMGDPEKAQVIVEGSARFLDTLPGLVQELKDQQKREQEQEEQQPQRKR